VCVIATCRDSGTLGTGSGWHAPRCPLDLQSGTTGTKQSGPGATLVFSRVAARSAAEVEGEPHFFLL